jgi:hypothetical protein
MDICVCNVHHEFIHIQLNQHKLDIELFKFQVNLFNLLKILKIIN